MWLRGAVSTRLLWSLYVAGALCKHAQTLLQSWPAQQCTLHAIKGIASLADGSGCLSELHSSLASLQPKLQCFACCHLTWTCRLHDGLEGYGGRG